MSRSIAFGTALFAVSLGLAALPAQQTQPPTFNAATLTFKFIPTADTISFQYVFGSEEYSEFVGTPFNDTFAFLLNGHNIALISVQAGVALHLLDQRPEQARVALAVIREASKDALRELRSVLDVLRQGNETPPRAPSRRRNAR